MVLILLLLCHTFLLWLWRTRRLPLGRLGLCFWTMAVGPPFISGYDLLEEIWFFGNGLNQVIINWGSFCSGSRSCGTNFATTRFMPRSCSKISDTAVFGSPRSAPSSHRQLPVFVDCSLCMFNILRGSACCEPCGTWISQQILDHHWSVCATLVALLSHLELCFETWLNNYK